MPKSRNQAKYDTTNPLQKYLINRFLKRVAGEVNKLKGKEWLDAGCGEAVALKKILSYGTNPDKVCGVDISKEAVCIARKNLPKASFKVA
ncbi:class I SAM-dependent methyltransferase, partial [Patescibacteria group bacterium]|nr:class I SAM-dependent methyltransferase [Patescibacteria group bacterium]